MSYLSTSRPVLRNIIRRAYSTTTATGELESKSSTFNPEDPPTYSNGLFKKETLERFYPHVGNRDVVGYGWNGKLVYHDSMEFPYPSIRFGENSQDVLSLRQKEKGDWSSLSVDEKKTLYRASFCNNYAEMRAPTGYWKDYVTSFLVMTVMSLAITLYLNDYGLPYTPVAFDKDYEIAVQKRKLLLANDCIEYQSGYNYETHQWEK